jgi:uncharacterized iron-regulated membrane protein
MSQVRSDDTEQLGGFRQAMAWLHTWGGLWACWVLFVIFLTGTLGVFDEPITRWLKPEQVMAGDAGEIERLDRPAMVRAAQAHLQQVAPRSHFWSIALPRAEEPTLRVFWEDENEKFQRARLDIETGRPVPATAERETDGGHHFVHMHFEFHAGTAGIWLVGFFTMAMLVALVSGIVIHKRIFKDFFTFRPGKGQRSWLDAHNAASVLSLPFQLMIAYTGLATFYSLYMPLGIAAHYKDDSAYFSALLAQPPHRDETHIDAPVTALDRLLVRSEQQLGRPASFVVVEHPGDTSASARVFGLFVEREGEYTLLGDGAGRVDFDGVTGEQWDIRMPAERRGGAAQDVQSVMANLHFARFGGEAIRWLYFVCGLAGAAMMATGGILFAVKRRQRTLNEFGARTPQVYRVVDVLNVGTIAGLSLACIAFFWANRLIPLGIAGRAGWEIGAFFAVWLLALGHAAWRPVERAWIEQSLAFAGLCLMLPFVNWAVTGEQFVSYLLRGDGERAGVELVAIAFGLVGVWVARRLTVRARQPAAAPRTRRSRVASAVESEVA